MPRKDAPRNPSAGGIGHSVTVGETREGDARVTVIGEFDQAAAPEARAALEEAIDIGGDVELDLRACDFVDSIGISTLVLAARRLHEADRLLTIIGARERVLRILELTGIISQDWIRIEPAAGAPRR